MSRSELRSLDQILALADNGNYLPDLLERHEKLIAEMIDFSNAFGTKATGKMTLKIAYSIDRFGQIELTVEDEIKTPKQPKAKATAWTTENGRLTPANPNQMRMEIRDVAGTRELRTATDD